MGKLVIVLGYIECGNMMSASHLALEIPSAHCLIDRWVVHKINHEKISSLLLWHSIEKHVGRANLPNLIANLLTLYIVDFNKASVTRTCMDFLVDLDLSMLYK